VLYSFPRGEWGLARFNGPDTRQSEQFEAIGAKLRSGDRRGGDRPSIPGADCDPGAIPCGNPDNGPTARKKFFPFLYFAASIAVSIAASGCRF